jgi:HlyD family secretion protein
LKRLLLLLLLIPLAVVAWWAARVKSRPPEAPFAKVARETLISTLPTNGKVEPIEWAEVRAEAAGLVRTVAVQEGRTVEKGGVVATLAVTGLEAEIAAAEARLAQARAELAVVEAGGKSAELTEIQNEIERARFDRERARKEMEALQRLVEKQAATPAEAEAEQKKVNEADLRIAALERRRAALVGKTDRSVALARVRDAEAALAAARAKAAETLVRAPMGGVVYSLAVRPGAYLEAGAPVASVGRIDSVRVRVYVDEPELGRVEVGQPVVITWDALPGRKWHGTVERKPTEIEAMGTRQVGEVLCTIANPGRELLPGTNVNAEIRTSVVEHALTIPREALRREGGGVAVFVLRGDRLARQAVTTGASSVTRVQVLTGLRDGDSVALPSELALTPGLAVRPVYP